MEKIGELSSFYELKIKGIIYNELSSFDEVSEVDDLAEIDSTTNLNSDDDISSLINFLFNVPIQTMPIDNFSMDEFGNLFAAKIHTMVEGFEDAQKVDTNHQVDNLLEIDTEGEVSSLLSILADIKKEDMQPDVFSVLKNSEVIVNNISENQQI